MAAVATVRWQTERGPAGQHHRVCLKELHAEVKRKTSSPSARKGSHEAEPLWPGRAGEPPGLHPVSLCGNQIIDALPRADRARLLGAAETVPLTLAQVLGEPGSVTRHVYFPTGCVVSLVVHVDQHSGLEVGMIGREGMLGVQLALGRRRDPLKSLVQGPGPALRVAALAFAEELGRSAALRALLGRYADALMTQRAQATGCVRFHEIGQRLARWLLMCQDRAGSDAFHITQELMACMLGVRREGITAAAFSLQRQGLIQYHRGAVEILDRAGLLRMSCSCYAADQRVHEEAMGNGREPARSPAAPGTRLLR